MRWTTALSKNDPAITGALVIGPRMMGGSGTTRVAISLTISASELAVSAAEMHVSQVRMRSRLVR
jgi:hypothetical protein